MDIKEYIASGIIERYVFGQVTPQEKQEVECMSHIYPEINQVLRESELAIEKLAMSTAKKVPVELKGKIMKAIAGEAQDSNSNLKIVSKEEDVPKRRIRTYQLGVAASLILAIGMGLFVYQMANSNKELKGELSGILIEKDLLASENSEMKGILENVNVAVEEKDFINSLLANINTTEIKLKGTQDSSSVPVRVFWNPSTRNVLVKIDNLPSLSDTQDYQLWAIIDGKPSDMGVLNVSSDQKVTLLSQLVDNASAFAITIEQKGGNPTPTLSALTAIGSI